MSNVLRPTYQVHVDDRVAALRADRKTQAREIDDDQRKLFEIANLDAHPGWHLIKKSFQETIDNYRSGRVVADKALDSNVSNEEYGQLTRMSYLVARELERHLSLVEQAVAAQEELKSEARNVRAGGR